MVQADDLALALGVDGNGDYGGDADDATILANLEVGGVKPEIGPFADKRALEEGVHPFVDVLAQLRHARLGDARHSHRLDQFVDAAGADAGDPCFLDHRDQRLLGGLARLEEAGEVGSGPQLRDLQVERPEPGIERAVAIAVAPGATLAGSFVPAGTDQAIGVGLHDDLQHALGHGAQKVAVSALRHQLGKGYSVVGHRGSTPRLGVKSDNSTLPMSPVTTTTPLPGWGIGHTTATPSSTPGNYTTTADASNRI